jgi:hypothetical protein
MGWYDSSHPIMQGVSSTSGRYRDDVSLTPGAVLVAEWVDGVPFVATKETVVGISLYPGISDSPDYDWTGEVPTLMHNALAWAAEPEPPFQHSLRLNPFTDVVHLNLVMPDRWIYGIDEAGYVAPILGKVGSGKVYWACDLPGGPIEMYFVEIDIATRDGYMYRIHDDLTLVGPTYVWLTPATGEAEGASADDASVAESWPQAVHTFQLNPYSDVVYLYDDIVPWLYGYHDVEGSPEYPAPMLGFAGGGRFYWGADFVDGSGGFELLFLAGSVGGKDGYIIRTTDGYSYSGPTYVWLSPVGFGETYEGATAKLK